MHSGGRELLARHARRGKKVGWIFGVFAELAHQKEAKFIFQELSWEIYQEDSDSKDQESGIVGIHNHLR